MRVDGILSVRHTLPSDIRSEIIARIKILAGLRSDEHNAAQDGRFRHESGACALDIRVSVMPTYHGENAVLRLLGEGGVPKTLADLGYAQSDIAYLTELLTRNSGLILSTGPTGSGKTTTLYTLLGLIDPARTSVVTIEDPIEYGIPGVRQIPVREQTGLTFASGLRSILRQDPDVIMVGEVRDEDTARLSVNAALTGHLVLSTLHTTDAVTAIPRLLDMNVEPYLLASTLTSVLAQRLVRKTCTNCRKAVRVGEKILERIPVEYRTEVWIVGEGCDECSGTGYLGRIGIYELLKVDDDIRDTILSRASAAQLRSIEVSKGTSSLLECGIQRAVRGETTLEEVFRVIHE